MNGRFEEKLMQLAFGELSPSEAARVEAQAAKDPEAARLLASYRVMQTGMQDLTEIPEDQLSKERLRDAILMQGLKPKPEPKSSPWGWAWMPVMACALAAGLMMMNGRFGGAANQEPVVAIGDKSLSEGMLAWNDKPFTTYDFNKDVKPVAKAVETKPVLEPEKKLVRYSPPPEPEEYIDNPNGEGEPIQKSKLIAGGAKLATNPSTVIDDSGDQPPVVTTPAPPIVIIEENKDESTGAYRATEVGTASNVLIGG